MNKLKGGFCCLVVKRGFMINVFIIQLKVNFSIKLSANFSII